MATRTRLTADDLWRMGSSDVRRELIDGVVVEMAPTGRVHGEVMTLIASRLHAHVQTRGGGKVLSGDVGFVLGLPHDTDRVRAPDVAFVSEERLAGGRAREGFLRGAPDLAVEILSPTDNPLDVQRKVRDWLEAGTRLVWVVAPAPRTTTVYRADGSARLVRDDETLDGEDVLPGLSIRLSDVLP
jgi:Uma2 family endonuclease